MLKFIIVGNILANNVLYMYQNYMIIIFLYILHTVYRGFFVCLQMLFRKLQLHGIEYVPYSHMCLFQSKLYNISTASGLGVLVEGGENYVQYRVFESIKHLPAYLQ